MAINYVDGNLLDAKEDIIGHQCNAQGVMGSGIARQIRFKYPHVYAEYSRLFEFNRNDAKWLGYCQIIDCSDKMVANLIAQHNYGRDRNVVYTDYAALEGALKYLKVYAQYHDLSVALPYRIGCGLANGDWESVVHPMLQEIFNDYKLTLYRFI